MIEVTGNLWSYPADARVITTNGTVKNNGCAVMGRGCAYEASQRYPQFPPLLGTLLKQKGNHVHYFDSGLLGSDVGLFTFPVKHAWFERADLELIRQSINEIAWHLLKGSIYVMPRPGCGNGHLRWEDVKPIVAILPDNVHIITWPKGLNK